MRLLMISGSLRAASSNTAVLEAAALVAPSGVEMVRYKGLSELPHFNPDLDDDHPPAAVSALRREIDMCDGLLICSPEYAHGVAGSLKNALDWLVSSLEFPETPVATLNASPRAFHAQAHLRETLLTMSARLIEKASISLPLNGRGLDAQGIALDPELHRLLRTAMMDFVEAIGQQGPPDDDRPPVTVIL